MGNSNAKNEETEQRFRNMIASLHHLRKEHSDSINWDVDLYRPENPEFEESLLVLVEIPLDESYNESKPPQQIVDEFINHIKSRQNIKCPHLTQLHSHFLILQKRFCAEFPVGELFLDYSEENLAKQINDSQALRASITPSEMPPPVQLHNLLTSLSDALQILNIRSLTHGFVLPANILIFNASSIKPHYKLLDVALLSKHSNLYERMMIDKNFFGPLDYRLLKGYESKDFSLSYGTEDDVWGLGVSALCFLFKEDFNSFYDWNKFRIRKDKIDSYLQTLYKMNYNQQLVRLLSEMLDVNPITRIKLSQLCESLRLKFGSF